MSRPAQADRACEILEDWQRSIVDHKFNPSHGSTRIASQQALVGSLLRCGPDVTEAISVMASRNPSRIQAITTAAASAPTLSQSVSGPELDVPQWSTDVVIHDSLSNTGMTRSLASDYRYWHITALQQIRHKKVPDGAWLLSKTSSAFPALPFAESVLRVQPGDLGSSHIKELDNTTRNILRRAGGIWLRAHNFRLDSPLARSWWRVELSNAAAEKHNDLSAEDVYDRVLAAPGFGDWFKLTTVSFTRMASPCAIAALALVRSGPKPSQTLGQQLRILARRTVNVNVNDTHPQVLADIIIA